jgi:hypothetical protein
VVDEVEESVQVSVESLGAHFIAKFRPQNERGGRLGIWVRTVERAEERSSSLYLVQFAVYSECSLVTACNGLTNVHYKT